MIPGDAYLPGAYHSPWLPGVIRWPDDEYLQDQLPRLHDPQGIVIHSGSRNEGVAEYTVNEGDGRRVSYHLVWSARYGELVQTVPLTHRAWHAGPWNDWLSICLPGPWNQDPRDVSQRLEFRRVCGLLVATWPEVLYWTRHSIVAPDRRDDPGPGFLDSWMDGLGLDLYLPSAAEIRGGSWTDSSRPKKNKKITRTP